MTQEEKEKQEYSDSTDEMLVFLKEILKDGKTNPSSNVLAFHSTVKKTLVVLCVNDELLMAYAHAMVDVNAQYAEKFMECLKHELSKKNNTKGE